MEGSLHPTAQVPSSDQLEGARSILIITSMIQKQTAQAGLCLEEGMGEVQLGASILIEVCPAIYRLRFAALYYRLVGVTYKKPPAGTIFIAGIPT